MAFNPQLLPDGMPVPFLGELFVLARQLLDFEVDKIPVAAGGQISTRGTIYVSNIRLVFVANKPIGNFVAFDMPLAFIHDESFNQPIFFCNYISGKVDPVIPNGAHEALYSPHSFKLIFKEGGCGTFVPLFFGLLKVVRQYRQQVVPPNESRTFMDPLATPPPPTDEVLRHAYMDPNDPTKIYLQQPFEHQLPLRRRNYTSAAEGEGQI